MGMKVKDLMTPAPGFCSAADDLAKAAEILWERDCGVVPVVDDGLKVVGMITDRDICRALTARNKKAAEINAGDLATGKIVTCRTSESVLRVLKLMKKNQLRRLPVIDGDKKLAGIISLRDLISASERKKSLRKKVFSAILAISRPRAIVLHEIPD